jgi:hypothetical protein
LTVDPAVFATEDGLPVTLPSGAELNVLATAEVDYVNERVRLYNEEFRWTNVSDIQDVDRIVLYELMIYRWGLWVSLQKDYFDEPVNEQSLRKSINDYSAELRQIKRSLGMDKASRDRERGESIPDYLDNLRKRALEFGVNRNKMMDKGIELAMQAISLAQLWANCTEDERIEQVCTGDDVAKWLFEHFTPEFMAVDKAFREGQQKYWVSDQ